MTHFITQIWNGVNVIAVTFHHIDM